MKFGDCTFSLSKHHYTLNFGVSDHYMKQGCLCFSIFLRDPGYGYKSILHSPNRASIPEASSTIVALAFHVLGKHARGGSILMPARGLHLNCGPLPERIKLTCIQGIRLLFRTRQARLLSYFSMDYASD